VELVRHPLELLILLQLVRRSHQGKSFYHFCQLDRHELFQLGTDLQLYLAGKLSQDVFANIIF
jgi:hypothetical protein